MKRLTVMFLAILIASSLCSAATVDEGVYQRMASILNWYYGPSAAESQLYVGAEMCLACHPDKAGWRDTLHATGLKATNTSAFSLQAKNGVVADANQNGVDDFIEGLDFNKISSVFDKYKPNAPILSYSDQNGYQITIGQVTHPVGFAYGTTLYKQRYMMKVRVTDRPGGLSAGYYASPVQYNEGNHSYAAYHPETWWDDGNAPLYTPSTTAKEVAAKGEGFDAGCSGCHFTGLNIWQDANNEWRAEAPPATLYFPNDPHYLDYNGDKIKEAINTGCERCHGPGSEHVLGRGDPEKIINPETDLTVEQAIRICGSCHTRGHSKPGHVMSFPYDETTKTPYAAALGEKLNDRFWDPAPGLWPDGKTSAKHRQQYLDFIQSPKPSNPYEKVTCFECHDIHENTKHMLTTEIMEDDLVIPVSQNNNTLCLSCHSTHGDFADLTKEDIANYDANREKIAKVTSAHTNHPYAPERILGLSRCTECHMPKVAKSAIPYDIASHTFEAIPPEKTLKYQEQGGMPSSCAVRCHRSLAEPFGLPVDPSLTTWNEPSDVALAQWLMKYYGPEGKWWKTGGGAE